MSERKWCTHCGNGTYHVLPCPVCSPDDGGAREREPESYYASDEWTLQVAETILGVIAKKGKYKADGKGHQRNLQRTVDTLRRLRHKLKAPTSPPSEAAEEWSTWLARMAGFYHFSDEDFEELQRGIAIHVLAPRPEPINKESCSAVECPCSCHRSGGAMVHALPCCQGQCSVCQKFIAFNNGCVLFAGLAPTDTETDSLTFCDNCKTEITAQVAEVREMHEALFPEPAEPVAIRQADAWKVELWAHGQWMHHRLDWHNRAYETDKWRVRPLYLAPPKVEPK